MTPIPKHQASKCRFRICHDRRFSSGQLELHTEVQNFEIKSFSDGLTLHGYRWSIASPVAAMSLVHGFGEHCGRYSELAEYLNGNGIEVIGVDLRGHGRTDSPRGVVRQYDDLLGDVRTLIDETNRLHPNLPQFLFGHSMGGGLALYHGLTTESDLLTGYLVSAPLIRLKRSLPFYLRFAVKAMQKINPRGTIAAHITGSEISTIPAAQELYMRDPLNHNRLGYGLGLGMIDAGEHVLTNVSQWKKPLCLWHSRADQINDFKASEQFAANASQCNFTALDDVQHEMHHDRSKEQVFELMVDFMAYD